MRIRVTASRTIPTTLGLLTAFAFPLGAQSADSIALDSTRQRLAPVALGLSAPARSIGSTRLSVDSTDVGAGTRPRTLSELLHARLPGVSVLRYGGDPSDGSRIRVRGTVSLTGDASPLVVIDGIPVNTPEQLGGSLSLTPSSRFDDFDPEEVERVDVLSGPAATTLFGGGASNGAIVITTKRGVSGRAQWRAWSQGAMTSEPTTYPANYRQNGTNPLTGAATTNCDVVAIAGGRCNPTTLNVWNPLESASPFRQGRYGAAGVSVAGGPFGIKAFASATGRAETSVLDDSWGSRINGRLNAERELFGRLTIGGNVGYVNRNATLRTDHVVIRGLRGQPVDDANRGYRPTPTLSTVDRDGDRLSRSARVEWRALSWLRVTGLVGRDELTQRDFNLVPALGSIPDVTLIGIGSSRHTTTRQWQASSIVNGTAEVLNRLGSSVAMRTLVSYEESNRRTADELVTTSLLGGDLLAAGLWTRSSIRSWMVQERIGVADRLFLNFGARRIAKERGGNRGRWHPSVDAAWEVGRIGGDAALRLRGAYAVGIHPRDTSLFPLFIIVSPFEPAPAPIEPEEPREAEIGLEARWGTRLELGATYFDQQTANLITLGPASPSLGFGLNRITLAKMLNRGVEVAARVGLVDRPTTRWTASVTLATLRNRMSQPAGPPSIVGPTMHDGQPYGVFYRQRYAFVDANGDGLPAQSEISLTNPEPDGTVVPTREASLRSELGLRRWGLTLSAALDHRGGHRAYNMVEYFTCAFRQCRAWQDPSAPLAAKVRAVAGSVTETSSVYLEDASYTRLGELALAWTPPARFTRAVSEGLTIVLEARNVATWTSFGGPDPEVATTSSASPGLQQIQMLPAVPRAIGVRVEWR